MVVETALLSSLVSDLPIEVGGLRKHTVVYSAVDVSERHLVLASEQGYVWLVDMATGRLLRELSVRGSRGGEERRRGEGGFLGRAFIGTCLVRVTS